MDERDWLYTFARGNAIPGAVLERLYELRRVVECHSADKLPYAGGLFDQPRSFVELTLYLKSQINEFEHEEEQRREGERKAEEARAKAQQAAMAFR